MQEFVIRSVKKVEPRAGGKTFYAIKADETDFELTSFEGKFMEFAPGTRIRADTKFSGKYINIVKWELVDTPQPPATPGSQTAPDGALLTIEYQLKARLQRELLASNEARTAYLGIITASASEHADDSVKQLLPAAIAWAKKRLAEPSPAGTPTKQTDTVPGTESSIAKSWESLCQGDETVTSPPAEPLEHKRDPATITSWNDLCYACHEDFNSMQPAQILRELGVKERSEIGRPWSTCYLEIAEVKRRR